LAAKLANLSPVLYSPHCYYFYQKKGLVRWFFLWLERFAGLFTTKIVAVSEGERKLTVEENIVKPDNAVCITNGIDTSGYDVEQHIAEIKNKIGIEPDSPVIGTISRYSRQKGFKYFFRAASIIKKRYPKAVFLFIGKKDNDSKVRNMIKELNIANQTIRVDHSDRIHEYISVMDVFVLTSLWEGMPYALLEVMAMQKPVVASNITGVNEVVKHKKTGYLVTAGDTETFASYIVKLLDDPAAASRMGAAGRTIIERDYRIETQIDTLTDLYKDLLRVKNT
jgi:glycosyltransferase involved in cell wall biosynthesis